MNILRASCSLVAVVVLLGGWGIGLGCRSVSVRKTGGANTNTPPIVAKPTKEAATSPRPTKTASSSSIDKTLGVKPVPDTTTVSTNKSGFFAWLFGSKTAKTVPVKPETAVTVPKFQPVLNADASANTNKTFVPYRIQVNDTLIISLRGITPEQPNVEQVVDENGEIKLPYINALKAEGRTPSELESLIRETYIQQKIYKRLTVNIIVPAMTQPTFYVKGEVRSPGRLPYVNGMTLLTAIAASGGPTDFATPNMTLLRGGKKIKFNYYDLEKYPEKDQLIQAGDIIVVDKSWF